MSCTTRKSLEHVNRYAEDNSSKILQDVPFGSLGSASALRSASLTMMPACRGVGFRQVNFPRSAKVFEKGDIPAHNLASKREVKVMRVPDLLGERPAGWNNSTVSENMSRFPDRPMMRQLAKYDSHKRADFNFRAETLDATNTTMYIPRPSKVQTNERSLDMPRLQQPHHISRCEFPVHPALEGKPRWDPATGHGGDPFGVEKAMRHRLERERVEAMEYSRRHPPKHRNETLIQREARFMEEQRQKKRLARQSVTAPAGTGWASGNTGTFGGDTAMAGFMSGYMSKAEAAATGVYGAEGPDILASQVPVRKRTTWSLGGF